MKICDTCGKRLWFWNSFNRKYGEGKLLSKNKDKVIARVRFCSYNCCEAFRPDNDIDFNKDNSEDFK